MFEDGVEKAPKGLQYLLLEEQNIMFDLETQLHKLQLQLDVESMSLK